MARRILAVAAGITRVMALPQVERFLARFVPWLAAEPEPAVGEHRRDETGAVQIDVGFILAVTIAILLAAGIIALIGYLAHGA